ncbi:hypothetical protein PENTCL1PPCAC_3864, partial [Pristionchus entomophagus]
MDIFALPDVFFRQLMRKMEMKDRLALRLTCRAFEKLVAGTHAGCFIRGFIHVVRRNGTLTVALGDAKFKGVKSTKGAFEQILHLRKRLFCGISFKLFELNIHSCKLIHNFTRNLTDNFHMDQILFRLMTDSQLEKYLKLIADFPRSKFIMNICTLSEIDKLLSLPQMECLKVRSPNETQISADLFLKLLQTHVHLALNDSPIFLSYDEWLMAMQTISADSRDRTVIFEMKSNSVVNCLRDFGISDTTNGHCGEFLEIHNILATPHGYASFRFRYRNCWIRIACDHSMDGQSLWTGRDAVCAVSMTNAQAGF